MKGDAHYRAYFDGNVFKTSVNVYISSDAYLGSWAKPRYCSATDSETTTFGRFYTGNGCQAMNHMSAFPEFFVRSCSDSDKKSTFAKKSLTSAIEMLLFALIVASNDDSEEEKINEDGIGKEDDITKGESIHE
ncbi:hypothetical protein AVEN_241800-1 [Araneus ventricosus]|uniref:Uncharacterized protein n=1 Tax=Araneus ventricosus TaxID=182803 RepID=A0A4Y2PQB8_ARAVE|nr:hypothetical protein AVEN_241800-1 [Araneus ventricosus]